MKNVPAPTRLWPALVALNGFGLAVNPAGALELGDITVHSTLGQPLRASIVYALAQNETIEGHCIFLRPPAAATGMPVIRNATAMAANGTIRLTGSVPIREPILSLSLTVDCPGTAHLRRDYMLFVDPSDAATAAQQAAAQQTATPVTARRPQAAAAAPALRPARPAAAQGEPIGGQSTYRVQPGDTLSGIAARIEDRDVSLWQAVEVIFAANPDAFIDNDRNLLKAGSLLVLPEMGTVTAGEAARPAVARTTTSVRDATPSTAVGGGPVEPAQASTAREPAGTATRTQDNASASRPVDASIGTDSPFVSPLEPANPAAANDSAFAPAREVIPDTMIEASGGRQLAPRVSVAPGNAEDGLGSLAWLGGTGIAIIFALLLFGRQLRDRFGSPRDLLPAGVARDRRRTNVAAEPEPSTTLRDDEPTDTFESPLRAQPVALDADLGIGSGFDDDGEMDVAQDFGFSTSRDLYGEVDLELTAEAAQAPDQGPTDSIPPKRFEDRRLTDTVIVEREIPPSDETGEYDLSMIVDATRQPIAEVEDATKDLHAVQVDTGDNEVLEPENLTLSREVDYKILEQDYEDELTATQALNVKLAREMQLASAADDPEATVQIGSSEAPTVEYAAVDEALTMQLPEDDNCKGDDYPDDDCTVEMPLDQDTAVEAPSTLEDSGVNTEFTTELPTADNDETIDIESATIDTKKLRAS